MHQTRLKQSVNHLRLNFEAFVFPKALFRNITGEATEAPTEFLANQTVLLKHPKKSSPFLHMIKCITDFICFYLVSSLRLVKTDTVKTILAVPLGPALSWNINLFNHSPAIVVVVCR